jgi:hypothetical protein
VVIKVINSCRFQIFNLNFEFYIGVENSELLKTSASLLLCRQTGLQKMWEHSFLVQRMVEWLGVFQNCSKEASATLQQTFIPYTSVFHK